LLTFASLDAEKNSAQEIGSQGAVPVYCRVGVWALQERVLILKTPSGDVQAFRSRSLSLVKEIKDSIDEAFRLRSAPFA
jgi:hypothetical protein